MVISSPNGTVGNTYILDRFIARDPKRYGFSGNAASSSRSVIDARQGAEACIGRAEAGHQIGDVEGC